MPEQLNDHKGESETGFSAAEEYQHLNTREQGDEPNTTDAAKSAEAPSPIQFTRRDIETGQEIPQPANTNKIEASEINEAYHSHETRKKQAAEEFNIDFFRSMHSGDVELLRQKPGNASLEASILHSEILTEGLLLTPEPKNKDTKLAIELRRPDEPGSPTLYEAYKTGTGGSHGNFLSMIETVEDGQRVTRSIETTGNRWDPVLYREIIYPEGSDPIIREYRESSNAEDLRDFSNEVLKLSDPDKVEAHLADSARIAELANAQITDQTVIQLYKQPEAAPAQKLSIVERAKQSLSHFGNWMSGPSSLQEADSHQ